MKTPIYIIVGGSDLDGSHILATRLSLSEAKDLLHAQRHSDDPSLDYTDYAIFRAVIDGDDEAELVELA